MAERASPRARRAPPRVRVIAVVLLASLAPFAAPAAAAQGTGQVNGQSSGQAAGPTAERAAQTVCDPGIVTLLTEDGPRRFEVELARTQAEQARGLMFRPRLAPGTGMLFVYDPPQPAAFWMKNTMIPLDMIFIDDRGRVANVVHRAQPYSLQSRRSEGPVRAVLEVNGGVAERLGIEAGTEVRHPAFREAPEAVRCPAE